MQLLNLNTYGNLYFSGGIIKKELYGDNLRRTKNSLNANQTKKNQAVQERLPENSSSLSPKSVKLIKVLGLEVENAWADLRRKKIRGRDISFIVSDNDSMIIFKPIYAALTPKILMEIQKGDFVERVCFDKYHPEDLRYEKVRDTPSGGEVSVKNYHSGQGQDNALYEYINDNLGKYVPKVLSEDLLNEYFPKLKRKV